MPCNCQAQGCENPCVCGEKYCGKCFLEIEEEEDWEDDTERNLYAGGRFYGEDLIKEGNKTDANT